MKILYFSWLREKIGIDSEEIKISDNISDINELVECGILKRMSASVNEIIKVQAISNFNQKCKSGRKEFLRGRLIYRNQSIFAEINGKPGAGVLTSLSGAHGLIEVDENTDIIKKGDIINFIPFKEALIWKYYTFLG